MEKATLEEKEMLMGPVAPPEPPSYEAAINDATGWSNSGLITEDEAIRALRTHCKTLFCWGEGPIEKMKINTLKPSTGFMYKINTWTENRTTSTKIEPYHGGNTDGSFNGPRPDIWSINVHMPQPFTNTEINIVVPHSETVKPCIDCNGTTHRTCSNCSGQGTKTCGSCAGGINANGERCNLCHGTGRQRCTFCDGNGKIKCGPCSGAGQMKEYENLLVKFHTHDDHYTYEKTSLDDELLTHAKGTNLLTETADRIGPIQNFHVDDINRHSQNLIQAHATKWPMERTWKQSHTLDAVPVFEINYSIVDGQDGRFWIYGEDRLIMSDDYPAQCCCCLNLPVLKNCKCCNSCTIL